MYSYTCICTQFQISEDEGIGKPVHWEKDEAVWRFLDHDRIVPVQNRPIPVIYPKEADEGLWGGEGMIKGLIQRREHKSKR